MDVLLTMSQKKDREKDKKRGRENNQHHHHHHVVIQNTPIVELNLIVLLFYNFLKSTLFILLHNLKALFREKFKTVTLKFRGKVLNR